MDMLQPCYGIGMCKVAELLLVPDIPLTDKKNSKKKFTTYFTLNQRFYDLDLHFTENVMSGIN